MQLSSFFWSTVVLSVLGVQLAGCGGDQALATEVPAQVQAIFNKPAYRNATWSLRVVDLNDGRVLVDRNAERKMLIGSVRKLFSVGAALDALGAEHVARTPVFRQGAVGPNGVLNGNLVLVASGDLTMGGRKNPDGSLAISAYDHNEANALGNAVLTAPDPLAGYNDLAAQVFASGIRQVNGDVIIDDRLFQPFNFRDEFMIRPIFVNDATVDVLIHQDATVDWRPRSAAFTVRSTLQSVPAGSPLDLDLVPEWPNCIGQLSCDGLVQGRLPTDFAPPFTGTFPMVQTFRIVEPSNYARTVFIEALVRAGVAVGAPAVAVNPTPLLPARGAYLPAAQVAELVSHPFKDDARRILKVSYNIGADMSTMLFGLHQGVQTFSQALAAEIAALDRHFGVPAGDLHFVDGSGGGDTSATSTAVIRLLEAMSNRPTGALFKNAQPRLGVDGSLVFVTDFLADPALAGARGNVYAKTGTYVIGSPAGRFYKAQALAGYIDSQSGRQLAFALTVNDVGALNGVGDVVPVFQDQGTIAALLWRLH